MYKLRIVSVAVLLIMCSCGVSPSVEEHEKDSLTEFHGLLEEGCYYEAFLKYPDVARQMEEEGIEEGAVGYEYQKLLGMTAGSGESDWTKIFKSPKIPLQQKLDLIEEIHANSQVR